MTCSLPPSVAAPRGKKGEWKARVIALAAAVPEEREVRNSVREGYEFPQPQEQLFDQVPSFCMADLQISAPII